MIRGRMPAFRGENTRGTGSGVKIPVSC
ncbi:hypothetical protein ESCNG_380003 [Neisseria gonorrhoeae]|uniref:Uncharacterized protein n=1 Tax=Neisseria gonorrhoeae TaxID=485 RepID=A0AB74EQZ3_NEIGO|nr:hypothetical protein ESCNG_380003 [Neisseria gonorrhoeae]